MCRNYCEVNWISRSWNERIKKTHTACISTLDSLSTPLFLLFFSPNPKKHHCSLRYSIPTSLKRWVTKPNHLIRKPTIWIEFDFPEMISSFSPIFRSNFGELMPQIWLYFFIEQERWEEGLLDGDLGEEKGGESSGCGWGGQRWQFRCVPPPCHHGKAPAFPWRHYIA